MKLDAQQERLADLIRQGATIADFVRAFNDVNETTALAQGCAGLAQSYGCVDGENLQVDEDVLLSETDDGIWVSAWIFVPQDHLEEAGLWGKPNPENKEAS
jgi:hypothetical protein